MAYGIFPGFVGDLGAVVAGWAGSNNYVSLHNFRLLSLQHLFKKTQVIVFHITLEHKQVEK